MLLFLPKLYSFSLGLKYLDPADPKRYQPAILKADDLDDKVGPSSRLHATPYRLPSRTQSHPSPQAWSTCPYHSLTTDSFPDQSPHPARRGRLRQRARDARLLRRRRRGRQCAGRQPRRRQHPVAALPGEPHRVQRRLRGVAGQPPVGVGQEHDVVLWDWDHLCYVLYGRRGPTI